MAYKADMKKHLSIYKLNRLGVEEHSEWDGRKYTHILPISHKDLNLLEPYRIDLAEHIEKEQINRHWGFHHLTSSQVVCLNFFYPLIKENQLTALLEVLDMSDDEMEVLQDSNASGRLLNQYSDFAEKYLPLEGGR